jgi:hypothetical protein
MMNTFINANIGPGCSQKYVGKLQLENVLHTQRPLPAYSIFLGLCDDGVPLVLDLTDSHTGSFLIAGDDDASNFKLLSGLLTAAYCFNSQSEVNIHLISPQLDDFPNLLKSPHLNLCLNPQQIQTTIAIEELVNLGFQREEGESLIPFHLVAIDGLDILVQNVDQKILSLISWLVKNGPKVGIFVMATIATNRIKPQFFSTLGDFQSRILNAIADPGMARYISGMMEINLSNLNPDLEAVVISDGVINRVYTP